MSPQKYFIQEFYDAKDQFKFQTKVEKKLIENNFIEIRIPKKSIFKKILFAFHFYIKIKKGDILFFQYPLFSRSNKWLISLAKIKQAKVICLVTDLDSIRDKQNINDEFTELNNYQNFIVQNDKMLELFNSKLKNKKYSIINLFDIHYYPQQQNRTLNNTIVFAGNVAKAPFVFNLNKIENLSWNIYSQEKEQTQINTHFDYVDENQLDKTNLFGSFGLVWDGEFLENIFCPKGEYLKYVSPLKLSKYILAGLPIIIHEDAAMADFIIQNNIGICVSSLFKIQEKIKSISETEYQQMIENLKPIAEKISTGYYLQTAIENVLKK